MKILFISKYAGHPKYSRVHCRPFHLCKEWQCLGSTTQLLTSDSNHFTTFPKTNKIINQHNHEGVDIIWVKTIKYQKTASIKRILSWIDFEIKNFILVTKHIKDHDIVIVSSLSLLTIIYGIFIKYKFKSKLIFEVRDIWPLTLIEEGNFSPFHPLSIFLSLVESLGYKKSDLIVGTMPKLDQHVYEKIGKFRSFHFSPLGFDPNNYDQHEVKEDKYSISSNTFNIGYIGSMGISNGLDSFVTAIELLQEENISFTFIGDGDLRICFEQRLNKFKNVEFKGKVPQLEVHKSIKDFDLLYLSTVDSKVWNYGQSMNKVIEYMLAGKPILASYNGYPSMINEANCGWFFDNRNPEDLAQKILEISKTDRNVLKKMGENGRMWIWKNRTYNSLAREYLSAMLKITK